jgi:hypothetical protein
MAGLALAQTARFPGAVATDQDLLTAVDNAFSQLAAPVPDATALTINVNSGASFAGKSNFSVTIEGEQLLVCSVSGNTLNVCPGGRGFAGTTAAAHPAGIAVRGNNTAWHHNAQSAEIKAVEGALGPNLANVEKPLAFSAPLSRNANAITCPLCVITSGSYSDPAWLTLSKAKVGLGAVENTALSTWPGSTNLTTLGTLPSLTTANTPGNGQYSLKNGATDRWKLGLDGAETGSNAGSELGFWGYADDGTFLGRWLALARSGRVTYFGNTAYGADNAYDIGAPTTNRPRNVYAGTSISAPLFVAGTFSSKARMGAVASNVPRADMTFNAAFNGPNWARDDDTKSASILAMTDGMTDFYSAPAGTGTITWNHALRVHPTGEVEIAKELLAPKRHQQVSFTLTDPNVAIPANLAPVWVWRAEYSAATATQVWCFSDTGDAVIMLQHSNGPTNILAANLTCGASGSTTASFSAATIPHLYALGYKIISGTARQIMISVKYTGN